MRRLWPSRLAPCNHDSLQNSRGPSGVGAARILRQRPHSVKGLAFYIYAWNSRSRALALCGSILVLSGCASPTPQPAEAGGTQHKPAAAAPRREVSKSRRAGEGGDCRGGRVSVARVHSDRHHKPTR